TCPARSGLRVLRTLYNSIVNRFAKTTPISSGLRTQLEVWIAEAEKGFRQRSRHRVTASKSTLITRPPVARGTGATRPTAGGQNSFLLPQALPDAPAYISRIVPQINGCWDRGWYEACAVMVRRLVETVLIYLYERRGWLADLKDPA